MTTEATNREMAEAARRAAEIIQERGKATGVYEDEQGRVCAIEALVEAELAGGSFRRGFEALTQRCEEAVATTWPSSLATWSDLPTTTEQDIAAMFLQVADDLEVAP